MAQHDLDWRRGMTITRLARWHACLSLCRHPYHLNREEAQAWLTRELETVVRNDGLDGATLTRLASPSPEWTCDFDWLAEFRGDKGLYLTALGRGGACVELLADMRLLGMAPLIALADTRETIELQPT